MYGELCYNKMDKNRAQSYRNAAQRAQALKYRRKLSNLEDGPDKDSYSAAY